MSNSEVTAQPTKKSVISKCAIWMTWVSIASFVIAIFIKPTSESAFFTLLAISTSLGMAVILNILFEKKFFVKAILYFLILGFGFPLVINIVASGGEGVVQYTISPVADDSYMSFKMIVREVAKIPGCMRLIFKDLNSTVASAHGATAYELDSDEHEATADNSGYLELQPNLAQGAGGNQNIEPTGSEENNPQLNQTFVFPSLILGIAILVMFGFMFIRDIPVLLFKAKWGALPKLTLFAAWFSTLLFAMVFLFTGSPLWTVLMNLRESGV